METMCFIVAAGSFSASLLRYVMAEKDYHGGIIAGLIALAVGLAAGS